MSLVTPEKIRTLQRKLYVKAKAEPAFRFYMLYDKIYREDILPTPIGLLAPMRVLPGVDGVSFAQIEEEGLEAWLAGLAEELVSKTYRPDPVRRVMIPKPDGGERPLGIPTIRDRVVQTAAKLVLEPIFEADFEDNTYGYRPRTWGGRCSQESASAYLPGLHRCGGCRSLWLLRFNPARRSHEIGGASYRGCPSAAADQAVAEGADRRAGRGGNSAHAWWQGQLYVARRKAVSSVRCLPTFT